MPEEQTLTSRIPTTNNPGQVRKALQEVVASYFSQSAIDFRRDAKLDDGFGVMIEPIIGQKLYKQYDWEPDEFFAPVLSGYGYTSTLKGEGYINVVPGLGGGVDTRDGLRLTKEKLFKTNGNLCDYLLSEERYKEIDNSSSDEDIPMLFRSDIYGKTYMPPTTYEKKGSIEKRDMDDVIFKNEDLRKLNLLSLFAITHGTEDAFDRPQYLEWAMTLEDGKAKYWIIQIADIDKKIDHIDFGDYGEILMMANNIVGSGIQDCSKIARCLNPHEIEALYRFNKKNRDYLLLYSSRLTSSIGRHYHRQLEYSDFNNANVFLEIQYASHGTKDALSHLGGQLDMTNKLFGILDYHADTPPQWDTLDEGYTNEDGINVFNGNIKAVASEKQDKMVIYKQPDKPQEKN